MKTINVIILLGILMSAIPVFAIGDTGMIRARLVSLSTGNVITAEEGGVFNTTVDDSFNLYYSEDSRYQSSNPINWSITSVPEMTIVDKGTDFFTQGTAKIVITKAGTYTLTVTGSDNIAGKTETKSFNISAEDSRNAVAGEQAINQPKTEVVSDQAINKTSSTQMSLNQQNKKGDETCSNKDNSPEIFRALFALMIVGGYGYWKWGKLHGK